MEPKETIKTKIHVDPFPSCEIFVDGMGTLCTEGDSPIYLEFYEGDWVLHVWADIEEEEPTHRIIMNSALESRRTFGGILGEAAVLAKKGTYPAADFLRANKSLQEMLESEEAEYGEALDTLVAHLDLDYAEIEAKFPPNRTDGDGCRQGFWGDDANLVEALLNTTKEEITKLSRSV